MLDEEDALSLLKAVFNRSNDSKKLTYTGMKKVLCKLSLGFSQHNWIIHHYFSWKIVIFVYTPVSPRDSHVKKQCFEPFDSSKPEHFGNNSWNFKL